MLTFQYRILGRSPGNTRPTLYQGVTHASNHRDGFVAALAEEFGDWDTHDKPAINRLCDTGWADPVDVLGNLHGLPTDAVNACFDLGDHTFDVELHEVEHNRQGPDHDYMEAGTHEDLRREAEGFAARQSLDQPWRLVWDAESEGGSPPQEGGDSSSSPCPSHCEDSRCRVACHTLVVIVSKPSSPPGRRLP